MLSTPACPKNESLVCLRDGKLSTAEVMALVGHIDQCLGCQASMQQLTGSSWVDVATKLRDKTADHTETILHKTTTDETTALPKTGALPTRPPLPPSRLPFWWMLGAGKHGNRSGWRGCVAGLAASFDRSPDRASTARRAGQGRSDPRGL